MDKTAKLPVVLKALRDLLQAIERCEDNDFSEESGSTWRTRRLLRQVLA